MNKGELIKYALFTFKFDRLNFTKTSSARCDFCAFKATTKFGVIAQVGRFSFLASFPLFQFITTKKDYKTTNNQWVCFLLAGDVWEIRTTCIKKGLWGHGRGYLRLRCTGQGRFDCGLCDWRLLCDWTGLILRAALFRTAVRWSWVAVVIGVEGTLVLEVLLLLITDGCFFIFGLASPLDSTVPQPKRFSSPFHRQPTRKFQQEAIRSRFRWRLPARQDGIFGLRRTVVDDFGFTGNFEVTCTVLAGASGDYWRCSWYLYMTCTIYGFTW